MNSTNWFNNDASSAYQNELYRAANNERLANEARSNNRRSEQKPAATPRKDAHTRTTQSMLAVKPV